MTKRIKITFIALVVVVISCLGAGIAFSKYIKDDLNVGSFKVNIVVSGIVTTQEELKNAIDLKKDYVVNGGDYDEQILADGVNVTVGGETKVTEVLGGGLAVKNNGAMVVNNAIVECDTTILYAFEISSGGKLVINDGEFTASRLACCRSGTATLEINGGTFNVDVINGYLGFVEVTTVIIRGGTFTCDPSQYVAEGYEAVDNGDETWTVQTRLK